MRKSLVILFITVFLNSLILPVYPYTQMPEFLCEIGIKFYQQGRYDEALYEFKKALLVQPAYEPALKYIQMIQERKRLKEPLAIPEEIPREEKKAVSRAGAIKEILDLLEKERDDFAKTAAYYACAFSFAKSRGYLQKSSSC